MATISVTDSSLQVDLGPWEKLAIRRSSVHIPREAVSKVSLGRAWPMKGLGLRHGGFVISGLIKVGVWVGTDRARRLVSIRRAEPIVRISCAPEMAEGFSEIIISTSGADSVIAALGAESSLE